MKNKKYISVLLILTLVCAITMFTACNNIDTNINQNKSSLVLVNGDENINLDSYNVSDWGKLEKDGYTFDGFYSDEKLTNKLEGVISKDIKKVFPKWTPLKFKLTLVVDDKTKIEEEVDCGSKINLFDTKFDKEDLVLIGWKTKKDGDIIYNDMTGYSQGPDDITLYAVYVENNFVLTFTDGFGNELSKSNQKYKDEIKYPEDLTRPGLKFTGWSSKQTNMPAEDYTIEAEWETIEYKITYDNNGFTYSNQNVRAYNTLEAFLLYTPENKCWVDKDDNIIKAIEVGRIGDLVLTLKNLNNITMAKDTEFDIVSFNIDKLDIYSDNTEGRTVKFKKTDATEYTSDIPSEVGEYNVLIEVPATQKYAKASYETTFTIKKASFDITNIVFADSMVTYNGEVQTLTYTGNLPNGLSATLSNNQRTDAGSCVATLHFEADWTKYVQIQDMTATFTINCRDLEVTAKDLSKVYGSNDVELTYEIVDGSLLNGDTIDGTLYREVGENVGEYAIKCDNLSMSNKNYNFYCNDGLYSITQKDVTITPTTKSVVYGETIEIQYTADGLVGEDILTGELAFDGTNVGEYDVYLFTLNNNNYNLILTESKIKVEKSVLSIYCTNKTITYGEDNVDLTYTTSGGAKYSDVLEVNLTRVEGNIVGNYEINATYTLTNEENYEVKTFKGEYKINKLAIDLTINNAEKEYGDADPELSYTLDKSLIGTDKLTGEITRVEGEEIGTYSINSTLANPNYEINITNNNFEIVKRKITVRANNVNAIFGDDITITYEVEKGSLLADDEFTGALTYDNNAVKNAGDKGFTKDGNLALNEHYALTIINSPIQISQRNVTITANDHTDVTYGDPLTFDYSIENDVAGQELQGKLYIDDKNVGTHEIQSSLNNPNYNITYNSKTVNIIPRSINITVESMSKFVEEDDPPFSATLLEGSNSIVEGDTIVITREDGETVGTYKYIVANCSTNNNYNITFDDTENVFTINPDPFAE